MKPLQRRCVQSESTWFVDQCVTRRVSAWRLSSAREVPVSPATSTRCATRSRSHTSRRVWTHVQAPVTSSRSTSIHKQLSSVVYTSTYFTTSDGPSCASFTANTAVSLCVIPSHCVACRSTVQDRIGLHGCAIISQPKCGKCKLDPQTPILSRFML